MKFLGWLPFEIESLIQALTRQMSLMTNLQLSHRASQICFLQVDISPVEKSSSLWRVSWSSQNFTNYKWSARKTEPGSRVGNELGRHVRYRSGQRAPSQRFLSMFNEPARHDYHQLLTIRRMPSYCRTVIYGIKGGREARTLRVSC